MTQGVERAAAVREGPQRVLGRIVGDQPGPTLICVGGMHGNEPAGVGGLLSVLDQLADREDDLQGEFLALAGNRAALGRGRRFVDADLNRLWTSERVAAVRDGSASPTPPAIESVEQRQLLDEIDAAVDRSRGPVFFLDLHTTSGPGGPFATVGDTLRNRSFALAFPAPLILGLEELVDGTLVEYLELRGLVCAAFESGQHDDPRSVELAEAAIWIALCEAGVLPDPADPKVRESLKALSEDTRALPRVLEMRYRHPVEDGDGFTMNPGWSNFQPVEEGQVLARDRDGEVRAPESGRVLMPLYQEQGEDGFFVIREFNALWLTVSSVLRRLGLDKIIHWLPGIRRDPEQPDGSALVVNRVVARWFALELLHLLGYRKHRDDGRRLVVHRRLYDLPPTSEPGGGKIRLVGDREAED